MRAAGQSPLIRSCQDLLVRRKEGERMANEFWLWLEFSPVKLTWPGVVARKVDFASATQPSVLRTQALPKGQICPPQGWSRRDCIRRCCINIFQTHLPPRLIF